MKVDEKSDSIVNAFTYMKNMDQWGSGIPRLMENCQKAGLREPELMEIGGSFRINIFRNTELVKRTDENKPHDGIQGGIKGGLDSIQGGIQDSLDSIQGGLSTIQGSIKSSLDVIQDVVIDLTNTDKELLKLIASNVLLSQAEMAKILKWNIGKVKYINKLKRRRIIERVGSSQKGYWNILIDRKIFEKGSGTGE